VAFINAGNIVALDSPSALKAAHGEGQIKVSKKSGEDVYFDLKNPDHRQQLGELTLSDSIDSMHSMDATLEDIFVKLTGKSLA
jgi:fluoroquinolone transport system ATP-binding protein